MVLKEFCKSLNVKTLPSSLTVTATEYSQVFSFNQGSGSSHQLGGIKEEFGTQVAQILSGFGGSGGFAQISFCIFKNFDSDIISSSNIYFLT